MKIFKCLLIIALCLMAFSKSVAAGSDLTIDASPVSCYGKSDGAIMINRSGNIADTFQITVKDSSSNTLTIFDNGTKVPFMVKNLKAETYKIIYNSNGHPEEYKANITSPEILKANIITIKELKGDGATTKGVLEANPTGGTLPYLMSWSDNTGKQTGKIAKNLPMGIYTCTINDSKQCGPVTATFFLYQDEIKKYNNKKNKN
jgi:hypothetical protein